MWAEVVLQRKQGYQNVAVESPRIASKDKHCRLKLHDQYHAMLLTMHKRIRSQKSLETGSAIDLLVALSFTRITIPLHAVP